MAPSTTHTYQVGFARILHRADALDFYESPWQEIASGWPQKAITTWYNRTWRLTRIEHETETFAFAKIGFVNESEVSTLYYDEQSQSFVYGEAPSGVVVPFAIRKSDLRIAFQLRAGIVRDRTFTGALQRLLFAGLTPTWSIETIAEKVDLKSWVSEVKNVTQFDISFHRPNPNYRKNYLIKDVLETARAQVVALSAKAAAGESLDLDYPLFQQALDHVSHEYGKAKVQGTTASGEEVTMVKQEGSSALIPAHARVVGVGNEEIPEDLLAAELSKTADADFQVIDLVQADDENASV